MAKVIIVGSGVIGISTGLRLLEMAPNELSVIIYGEVLPPFTTGDQAAGLWTPYALEDQSMDKIMEWSKDTWDFAVGIKEHLGEEAAGVYALRVRNISDEKELSLPGYADILQNCRFMDASELSLFGEDVKSGFVYDALMIEGDTMIKYLFDKFTSLGGVVQKRKVKTLEELLVENPTVIINCAGVFAGSLSGDKTTYPIRGQIMRVKAPWVKDCYLHENGGYVIPRRDFVVLGGTKQKHDWNTSIDIVDREEILEKCHRMVPSLKNAKLLGEWAGLRPGRSSGVRIEKESFQNVPVVHNYGHGGSGLTMFWGCAKDAALLVLEEVRKNF